MTVHPDNQNPDREERIRALAYKLWEKAGRPEDEAGEHWHRAAEMIDAADGNKPPVPDSNWVQRSEETMQLDASPLGESLDETPEPTSRPKMRPM